MHDTDLLDVLDGPTFKAASILGHKATDILKRLLLDNMEMNHEIKSQAVRLGQAKADYARLVDENMSLRHKGISFTVLNQSLTARVDGAEGNIRAARRAMNAAIEAKTAADTNYRDAKNETVDYKRDVTHLREENGKLRLTLQERTDRISAMQVRVRDGQDAQTFQEGFVQLRPRMFDGKYVKS